MALGDVIIFNQFWEDKGDKLHDMSDDTFQLGLITSAATPLATTADPRWGAGGSTNFLTNEVTPGGNYSTGGESLGAIDNWSRSGATVTFDGNDISILSDGSNPTNARWGIIYNNTDAGKRCVGFLDLGADVDLSAGNFTVTWDASGIFDEV